MHEPTRPSPPSEPDWAWLARYVAGELSPGEARLVRAWADADPAHAAMLADVERLWKASPRRERQWDATAALERITSPERRPREAPVARSARGQYIRFGIGAVAAGIMALVAVRAVSMRRATPARTALLTREYAAAKGERQSVTLSDGTHIVVGPGSRLALVFDSAQHRTEARLDGEAVFTVRHDPGRAFVVRTTRLVARDIGTTFGVRDFATDPIARVIVREGSVAVGTAGSAGDTAMHPSAALVAGQMDEVGRDARLAPVQRVDAATALAWADGTLEFDGTPLREALGEIARWYDVRVRLADSAFGARRVSASFTLESAPEALAMIGHAVGLSVEQRDGAFVLLDPTR